MQRTKNKTNTNLLSVTGFDKKIKLKKMSRTWEFTRTWSMIFKLFETFACIIISNTQCWIYLSMIMSMYMNAGLISIVYPVSLFGYALIEETRPRKEYWTFIRIYTTGLLFFKFCFNLSILEPLLASQTFNLYTAYIKLGVYDYTDLFNLM